MTNLRVPALARTMSPFLFILALLFVLGTVGCADRDTTFVRNYYTRGTVTVTAPPPGELCLPLDSCVVVSENDNKTVIHCVSDVVGEAGSHSQDESATGQSQSDVAEGTEL